MGSALVFSLFYGLTPLVVTMIAYLLLAREGSEEDRR